MTLLTGKSALAGNFIGGRGGLGGFFGRHGAVFDIPGIRVNSTLVVVFKQGDIWQVSSTETDELPCDGGGCLKWSRKSDIGACGVQWRQLTRGDLCSLPSTECPLQEVE